jgi:hypothetical protein
MLAAAAASYTHVSLAGESSVAVQARDFTYPWLAARAVLRGEDPYAALRSAQTPWVPALFYPLPTALVTTPLAWLSVRSAAVLFIGLGMGLLAYAVTAQALWPLIMFASASAMQAAWSVQWSPLLMAAALWWPMIGLVVAKPTLGLPLVAFQRDRRALWSALVGGGLLVVASFVLQPRWLERWIATLRETPVVSQYHVPLFTWWGAVLIVAVTRWRRPEARLLIALACMPQNGFFYDQFPLLLVPPNRVELMAMAAASQLALLAARSASGPAGDIAVQSTAYFPYMIAGLYLPSLLFIMRRPNEGEAPAWLERLCTRLPMFLRRGGA